MQSAVRRGGGRGGALVLTFVAGAGIALVVVRSSGRWKSERVAGRADPIEETEGGSTRSGASELEALRRRIARMENTEQARGEVAGSELTKSAEEAALGASQKALKAKIDKYYTPAMEAKRFDSYFSQLDEVRRAEGVDVAWAQESQAAVRQALQGGSAMLSKLSLSSVECGRTLCRVELKSADATGKMGLTEWLAKVGGQLPEASVFVPPEGNHMTAYLAKPGASLPAMESLEHLVADLP
jgi:hypothetical protein